MATLNSSSNTTTTERAIQIISEVYEKLGEPRTIPNEIPGQVDTRGRSTMIHIDIQDSELLEALKQVSELVNLDYEVLIDLQRTGWNIHFTKKNG